MTINSVVGVRADISQMLTKLREVSTKSKVFSEGNTINIGNTTSATKSFADTLSATKELLSNVNTMQLETEKIRSAYVAGDKSVSMSQVVVASQKSKLAFEGLVTVRNKILEAYKEIMNMPV